MPAAWRPLNRSGRRRTRGHPLLDRLTDNEASLIAAYQSIAAAVSEDAAITPAAEWLIDNFHQVERQIRQVRSDLPPRYYRQLPKLATGRSPAIRGSSAWPGPSSPTPTAASTSMSGAASSAPIRSVQPLTIGELWASAITLRIILVENLRRIAERIVDSREDRRRADDLADRLLGRGGAAAESDEAVIADIERGRLSDAFLLQLVYRLRDQGAAGRGRCLRNSTSGWRRRERPSTPPSTTSSRSRSPPTSPCATSSPACGAYPTSIGRRYSSASASSTACSPTAAASRRWISRPATSTARAVEELARGSGLSELEVARRAVLAGAQAAAGSAGARRPPSRSRLLSLRRRPPARSKPAIGFRAAPAVRVRPFLSRARHRRLHRRRRACRRAAAGATASSFTRRRRRAGSGWASWDARGDPGLGCCSCAREPGASRTLRRDAVAGARTARRRAASTCARWSSCRRC